MTVKQLQAVLKEIPEHVEVVFRPNESGIFESATFEMRPAIKASTLVPTEDGGQQRVHWFIADYGSALMSPEEVRTFVLAVNS